MAMLEVRDCAGAIAALPADEATLGAARTEVARRTIDYPFGSGQAEEIALAGGWKPVVRQSFRPDAIGRSRTHFERLGLFVLETEAPHRGDERLLYAGPDPKAVRAAAEAELRKEVLEAGLLLGYPRCCAEAFADVPPPGRRNPLLNRSALARTDGTARARLNVLDLGLFHYLPWLPCSFRCSPSLAFADRVAERIVLEHGAAAGGEAPRLAEEEPESGCVHERFVAAIDCALGATRLAVLEDLQLSIEGRDEGGELVVERAWPTAQDRPARAALGTEAAEAAARLWLAVRPGARVRVGDRALIVDGRTLLRTESMVLARFA